MSWIAGLDLGGTRLRAAAVDASTGEVMHLATSEVAAVDVLGDAEPFGLLLRCIEGLLSHVGDGLVAVGLGATGPVHPDVGTITNEDTLPPSLRGPVVEILTRRFGVPATLLNDADAFALGEYHGGAARGARIVVGVTMGTGVGVGVVRDGVAVVGHGASHPETGHMLLDPSGPLCYCGGRGCWESYCSGAALGQAMDRATARPAGTWSGRETARAAERGDGAALEVFAAMGQHLGLALTNLVALLGPEIIVLGGGVAESLALYLPTAEETLRRFKYYEAERLAVRVALLGDRAGSFGAAYAAARELGLENGWGRT